MNIMGKRIMLRAIEPDDLQTLHTWFNDPETTGQMGEIHFPSSRFQLDRWFERIQQDEATIRLAVTLTEGQLIGYSGFWRINWRDRSAEHALLIGDTTERRKGYGREVILTCARYAFAEMGLHRLDACVLESNTASLKAYKSCGFQVEGTLREHALRHGRRIARVWLGLLAAEYIEWEQRTGYWTQGSE